MEASVTTAPSTPSLCGGGGFRRGEVVDPGTMGTVIDRAYENVAGDGGAIRRWWSGA